MSTLATPIHRCTEGPGQCNGKEKKEKEKEMKSTKIKTEEVKL